MTLLQPALLDLWHWLHDRTLGHVSGGVAHRRCMGCAVHCCMVLRVAKWHWCWCWWHWADVHMAGVFCRACVVGSWCSVAGCWCWWGIMVESISFGKGWWCNGVEACEAHAAGCWVLAAHCVGIWSFHSLAVVCVLPGLVCGAGLIMFSESMLCNYCGHTLCPLICIGTKN